MNVLKKFKSLLNGFGKGGDDVNDIADISRLETAVSATMQDKTQEWWDIFKGKLPQKATHKNFKPLPIAYISTAYLAQLITCELKYELADEQLNTFVQKNLLPKLDETVQLTLVGGYTVIKPYIKRSGKICYDVGTSRNFLPIDIDENGDIIEGIFFERIRYKGKIYERREHHRFDGTAHYVHNSAYLYGTRQRVELTEVPRWAHLLPDGKIPSDIPMIATFRTPYANNIDLDSDLPISIFANSVETLHNIDYAHSEYLSEFRKMSAKVFADETVLHGKKGIPDDYFVSVAGDGTTAIEQLIMAYAPQIREAEHRSALNSELRLYEVEIGVSCGTFTFDAQKGLVTATQVLSEDKTTYNTVAQLQRQLKPALEAIAQITANLARFYGYEVVDGEPAIEFGDSVFEDTGTEYNRRFQMVQAGMLKPEIFNSWYFGLPIEKARELLPEMTTIFGGDE